MNNGAFYTGKYKNLFAQIGISQDEIDKKVNETFNQMFFDPKERIYFETDNDMGYMLDTGNNDARTEGMSYGMMMAVQMNRKDIFDRLWRFAKTYMYQSSGKYQGYFAWSVGTNGIKNAEGPAPDGEEYFAMALFFASRRWGDGEPPFDYSAQARDILHHCVHQAELVEGGAAMWDSSNHYIKFVPETPFSDPSYHLPHFYELFSLWADQEDREFWQGAAEASRRYLNICCDKDTGMASEYAEFDGTPKKLFHDYQFYSDAYRVAMNIGLDSAWFNKDEALGDIVDKLQTFLSQNAKLGEYKAYTVKGEAFDDPALHPNAIIATTAAGSLAAKGRYRFQWVKDFWKLPLRKGNRRYYDNCLHFFCLLMLAGQFKIY
ncbi:glycosyl hydrolase family 8 [Clostridium oryzae]|uniref:Reducing end xylose-releasing exo-oligoxylanase n=1 Tax=Clostridium oryzae TaxID=1450648 RepID=A0A1V4IVX1_9CLOT|nr:glycosyl hydrolase family 8 [Clostridium oryzae]OPJ64043.1 reducing end xylose-releasing exo-oligoxylanase [Clostridium oryzae]